jgi:hypothetical protein
MAIIRTINSLDTKAPVTYLSNDEVAGTTTIRVKNTTGFTTGWGFQIGKTGQDTTEVVLGTVTNVGTMTCATLDFDHSSDTPVYGIKYDKVVFEKSTAGTAGTATPIAGGTIEYQPDYLDPETGKSYTIYDDTAGTATDAYKAYFRNSGLSLNSLEGDWITPVGLTFYSLGKLRERVRQKLWKSDFATDGEIDNWLNEWKDEMTNSAVSVNEDYSIGTVNVAFAASTGLGTVTTTDFKEPKRIEITYNGSDYFRSTKRSLNEYYPSEVVNSAHPYHNWEGNTVFKVFPNDDAGTAKIWFYRQGTPMVNDTDELDIPLRAYTKSFIDYGLGMALQKDGQNTQAELKFVEANRQKNMFTTAITPRDKSGPSYVRIEEVLSGEDNMYF